MLLVPQAIREGWSRTKLAEEAGICHATAADVLAQVSAVIATSSQQELGIIATQMQQAAAKERPAVVRRLERAGSLIDALLSKGETLLAGLDPEEDAQAEEEEEIERESQGHGGALQRVRKKITIEARYAQLAGAIKQVGGAAKDVWATFHHASGLAFAEEQAKAKLKQDASTALPQVPGTVIELDGEGSRAI